MPGRYARDGGLRAGALRAFRALVVETSLQNPLTLNSAVEQAVRSVGPGVTASEILTMEQRLTPWVDPRQFSTSGRIDVIVQLRPKW